MSLRRSAKNKVTTILIATGNSNKVDEFRDILADTDFRIVSLKDVGIPADHLEEGETYRENACHKAVYYANISGLPTLADDSGLEVEGLGGAPGLYSSRFLTKEADQGQKNAEILRRLANLPADERRARFVCHLALALPNGNCVSREADWPGAIASQPAGKSGFGYDPIFIPNGHQRTVAELSSQLKGRISHRAQAAAALRELLMRLGDEFKSRKTSSTFRWLVRSIIFIMALMLSGHYLLLPVRAEIDLSKAGKPMRENVLVERISHYWQPFEAGDVVYLRHPLQPDRILRRHILAIGGDLVGVVSNRLRAKGKLFEELLADGDFVSRWRGSHQMVPDGFYFVVSSLSGYAERGQDSRDFGWVPHLYLLGRKWPNNQ